MFSAPDHFLVDGHNLAVRCAHAMNGAGLTSEEGVPSGEAFTFLRALGSYRRRFAHAAQTVVWDGSSEKRKAVFEGYKASRGALRRTFPVRFLQGILPSLGVRQAIGLNDEADDVIGAIARASEASSQRVLILSTDNDLLQLVDASVFVLMPPAGSAKDRKETIYDAPAVAAEWGVSPSKLVELRAMVGDTSDEIPGAPDLGPKRASKLLAFHESLEAVLREAAQEKARKKKGVAASPMTDLQRKNLRAFEAVIRRNFRLMNLLPVDDVVFTEPKIDVERAAALLGSLDIRPEPVLDMFFPKQGSLL